MTPARWPPPAPPCSCRNPGVQAPGKQPEPPSCLHLPPACTAGARGWLWPSAPTSLVRLAPASLPRARTLPPRVRATLERSRGHSAPNFPALLSDARGGAGGGRKGWAGASFPSLIYLLGGFFSSLLETKAANVPGCGVWRVPVVPGASGNARAATLGALGGRFPLHTDGCFDSVERLT